MCKHIETTHNQLKKQSIIITAEFILHQLNTAIVRAPHHTQTSRHGGIAISSGPSQRQEGQGQIKFWRDDVP